MAPPPPEEARAAFPELSPVVLQLLWNRGVTSQAQADIFLGPDWSRDTADPWLFSHMKEAVARTFHALEQGEVITIHGDYDADGVCGSTVLFTTLRELARAFGHDEKTLTVYLPHREKEGYGFSIATAEHLHEHEHTRLVITVDCGISNAPAITRGRELGMDTIVCDHHTMPTELPEQAILLHPLVPGEPFPNKSLCGTGVAFKFASALIDEARRRGAVLPDGHEKWLLDLVAIATVTDVMPLTGENRVLEHYGLMVLNKTRRVGLKALMQVAGVEMGKADTWSIGFQLGPRINAAGRMGHASVAFNLLACEDAAEADRLAQELQSTNVARQRASDEMYRAAKAQIGEAGDRSVLFAWAEGWSAGLVGLVAGKLVQDYGRPVYVVGQEGEKFVGSGRSIPGFDVTRALHAAAEYLDRFGGHPQACGFSTSGEERFATFMTQVNAFAKEALQNVELIPSISVDAEVSLSEMNWTMWDALTRLAPFGEANPQPLFVARQVTVVSAETMGAEGKHLRLQLRSADNTTKKFVAFQMGSLVQRLPIGAIIDVAFHLDVNEWNGRRDLQCRVSDMHFPTESSV